MEYRSLGRCGTKVSVLGLGGWVTFGDTVTDPLTVNKIYRHAFESGINYFDTADIYAHGRCESVMAAAIAQFPRHHLVLSSKCFWPMSQNINDRGLSRKHIMESLAMSLRRLQTDYLDIYFCHRYDEETPLAETVRAMSDLVRQGKIIYWGTSEWTGAQIQQACDIADQMGGYRPQVEQPQYNLLVRNRFEQDIVPTTVSLGMGTVTWSPLASGLLTGKYQEGIPPGSRLSRPNLQWLQQEILTPEHRQKIKRFKKIAAERGVAPTHLAIAWTMAQMGVSSVILGVSTLSQLKENMSAIQFTIDPGTQQQLDQL